MHGCGPSNKMRTWLQPKETKVKHYMAAKGIICANKTECFSFKGGCVIWVVKGFKGDWVVVLRY